MRADKSLKPFEIRLYRHYRVVHGIRIALAFVLTFTGSFAECTGRDVASDHPVVVMGPISFWGNVVPRAFERIGGTILGSALGLVALKLELISLPVMVLWCAVAMFLCGWLALGKKPYQALLIGITLAVVVGAPPAICTPRYGEAAMLSLVPCWPCCSPASGRAGVLALANPDGKLRHRLQPALSGRVLPNLVERPRLENICKSA